MNLARFLLIIFLLALGAFVFFIDLKEHEVVILAVNDMYQVEGVDNGDNGGLARLRTLRKRLERTAPDLLFLNAGDFLFPSLLSSWSHGEHMIKTMNALDGAPSEHDPRMLIVFGSHEFSYPSRKDVDILQNLIRSSEFDWLGSNIVFAREKDVPLVSSANLKQSVIRESGGVSVGLSGLTENKKPRCARHGVDIEYVDKFLDPVEIARRETLDLRKKGAELVVALTHLPFKEDIEILTELGSAGPDLIIGGHEGIESQHEVNGRWIVKAGSNARTATVVRVRVKNQLPSVSWETLSLEDSKVSPDPAVQKIVQKTLAEHEDWFCCTKGEEPGCLNTSLSETDVRLIGEESEIRRYETNLGDWVADQARAAFHDADIAFISAGSLQLNDNISVGPITRRALEELLPQDNELVQIEIDKAELRQILLNATKNWSKKSQWLQISGFAFEHDPEQPGKERVGEIALIRDGKLEPFPENETVSAVTNLFLCEGRGAFRLLEQRDRADCKPGPSLKGSLLTTLQGSSQPIAPRIEGRICNVAERRLRPCLFPNEGGVVLQANSN